MALHTAYVRSIILYHFTSLVAAKIVTKEEVDKLENMQIRKILKYTNQIRTKFLHNVTSWYERSSSSIIESIIQKVENKLHPE